VEDKNSSGIDKALNVTKDNNVYSWNDKYEIKLQKVQELCHKKIKTMISSDGVYSY